MPGRVEIVRAVVPYYFQSPYSSGISSARESAIEEGFIVRAGVSMLKGHDHFAHRNTQRA
jgi:hypothetical protein